MAKGEQRGKRMTTTKTRKTTTKEESDDMKKKKKKMMMTTRKAKDAKERCPAWRDCLRVRRVAGQVQKSQSERRGVVDVRRESAAAKAARVRVVGGEAPTLARLVGAGATAS